MAQEKRSIASMESEAALLEEKIKTQTARLHSLQKQRTVLQERIDRARAFEIMGILQERNISFEDAAEILSAANPVISAEKGSDKTS